jgi:hypothetical protein
MSEQAFDEWLSVFAPDRYADGADDPDMWMFTRAEMETAWRDGNLRGAADLRDLIVSVERIGFDRTVEQVKEYATSLRVKHGH